MNRLIYILPKREYFSRGGRGSVTHALGVIEGFSDNNQPITVISGNGLDLHEGKFANTKMITVATNNEGKELSKTAWQDELLKVVEKELKIGDVSTLMVRYAASSPLLLGKLAKLARAYRIKSVVEVNSFAVHNEAKIPNALRPLALKFESSIVSKFDLVYVISKALKAQLLKGGCKSELLVVPNGASKKQLLKTDNLNPKEAIRFVYLGVMQYYYDFETLIAGFKIYKDKGGTGSLEFYGDGVSEAPSKELAKGLEDVYFHGRYKVEDLPEIVNANTDIMVLPYGESGEDSIRSPIKLFEYMALGAAILANDVGQISDIAKHGKTAYLYENKNPVSLADAMYYLSANPELRIKLAKQGQEDFIKNHTWKARMKYLGDYFAKKEAVNG